MKGKWSLEPKHPQSIISYCFVSGINHRAVAVCATDSHIWNSAQQVTIAGGLLYGDFVLDLDVIVCYWRNSQSFRAQTFPLFWKFTPGSSHLQIYEPVKAGVNVISDTYLQIAPPPPPPHSNLAKFPTQHLSLILMSGLPWSSIRPEVEITSSCTRCF